MTRLADAPRTTVARSLIRYAAGLVFAHVLSVAEVLVIVVALSGHTPGGPHTHVSAKYVITSVAVVSLATLAVLIGGVMVIAPPLRWSVPGHEPDTNQRRAAMNLIRNQ